MASRQLEGRALPWLEVWCGSIDHLEGIFMFRLRLLGGLLFGFVFVACEVVHKEGVQVTPQRPTFSSGTTTTASGTVEIEAGLTVDPGDSVDVPTNTKVGLSEQTELFLGWSPYRHLDLRGPDGNGPSDLLVGTRHRFLDETDTRPAAALQLATKLPTGSTREGLSSGEVDFFAAGIVSKDFETVSLTGFYQLGVLGESNDDAVDVEHGLALALGVPILEELGAFAELAGVFTPEQNFDSVFTTVGVAYALSESLVLDGAFAVGLNDDAPDFQVLVGLTFNPGWIFRTVD